MFPAFHRFPRPLIGFAALLFAGCATPASPPPTASPAPTIVIAVQVAGGTKPTTQQIARVYQAVTPELTRKGYRFAKWVEDADYVMVVDFTPDPIDPSQGYIKVVSFQPARRTMGNDRASAAAQLKEAQQRVHELDVWAESRAAPVYSVP